jgi:hypothetical protein
MLQTSVQTEHASDFCTNRTCFRQVFDEDVHMFTYKTLPQKTEISVRWDKIKRLQKARKKKNLALTFSLIF